MTPDVYGHLVDGDTRCVHWHGPTDVIAIRFPCCDRYYACHECHLELEDHEPSVWARDRFDEVAVLCGVCGAEMTISTYLGSDPACVACGASFNPRCALHHHLYFDVAQQGTADNMTSR